MSQSSLQTEMAMRWQSLGSVRLWSTVFRCCDTHCSNFVASFSLPYFHSFRVVAASLPALQSGYINRSSLVRFEFSFLGKMCRTLLYSSSLISISDPSSSLSLSSRDLFTPCGLGAFCAPGGGASPGGGIPGGGMPADTPGGARPGGAGRVFAGCACSLGAPGWRGGSYCPVILASV